MMRPSTDVADKAVGVSTEDLQREFHRASNGDGEAAKEPIVTNTALELVRLEAVLSALVESKVIAIKAAGKAKKAASRPRSLSSGHQGKLQRLTSTSTASSSHQESLVQNPPLAQYSQTEHQQKRHHHHHHHHHHHRRRHHKHKRQSDSALLSSGILFPKKRYRHHHIKSHELDENGREDDQIHSHDHCHHCKQIDNQTNGTYSDERRDDLRTKSATNLAETTFSDENEIGSRYSLNEHMNASHDPSTSCQNSPFHTSYPNYSYNPVACNNQNMMVNASCCPTPTNSQSKILVSHGEADHVSLNMEPDEDEEEAARRRKRRRRRKNRILQGNSDQVRSKRQKRIDPEDLPKRARWTIIATACLLLLMSVLLVGVTLRMAPIIDEMVRKENEQLMNSFGDDDHLYNATQATSTTTLDPTARTNISN